jgi:hypothetical protein
MSKLERAMAGYDERFERKVVDEITAAIANTSMLSDGDGHQVLALCLGQTASALTTILASTLALSPSSTRSRAAIKQLAAAFRRKLQACVRAAEQSPDLYEFKRRVFHSGDRARGGNA